MGKPGRRTAHDATLAAQAGLADFEEESVAEEASDTPPETTPDVFPDTTPEEFPEVPPDAIPQSPPEEFPEVSPDTIPAAPPEEFPEVSPDAIPAAAPKEFPDEIAAPSPDLSAEPPGFDGLADEYAEEPPPAPVSRGLRIAVIVCTHNRYDTIGDTLGSLEAQSLPPDEFEVLVVDNSTDLAAQKEFWRLNRPAANARLIIEPIPGLSRARNIGFRRTVAPVVVYIDDDAVAAPDWLGILAEVFETTAECGVAGGPVVPVWGNTGGEPGWLHPWQRGFLTIVDRGPGRRRLGEGEWLAGTNIAFRRDLLERFGGFSEGLGRIGNSLLSNEELEISGKIAAAGFTTWYDQNAQVLHRVHANRVSQAWLRRRVGWQAISDQMSTGQNTDDDIYWARLFEYFEKVPVEMRGVRGLFLDTGNPELYYAQCRAIEALVSLLIGSGRDPEQRV